MSISNKDGTFRAPLTISGLNSNASSNVGDFNGDGLQDIVSNDATGIKLFFANGDGTFGAPRTVVTGNFSASLIRSADFNGDGLQDFALASSEVAVYLQNKNGTFGLSSTIPTESTGFIGLAINDFNGDGASDIAELFDLDAYIGISIGQTQDGIGSIATFSLKTKSDALQSFSKFEDKLKILSLQRGQIGAFQSRVTTAINVLQSSTENFKAAESRIRDTDVAKDSAELTRLQILQEAGISVLSQANLQPQIALKLLQN